MTQRFKLITAVLASFFTSFIIHASIVFTPNKLSIDLISPDINYGINIGLPNGLIMTGSNIDCFFKLHIPYSQNGIESSPCIAGNSAISFYYKEYNHKQWIYCREAFIMSDIDYKSDIQPIDSMLKIVTRTTSKSRTAKHSQSLGNREFEYLSSIIPNGIEIIDGDTVVNYAELIPVLIKATQELKEESERQEKEISELQQRISQNKNKSDKLGKILSYTPNPATSQIIFTYETPNCNNAQIIITDLNGNVHTTQKLQKNQNQTEITIDQLQKGFYHAILTIDNTPTDVVRIIKN